MYKKFRKQNNLFKIEKLRNRIKCNFQLTSEKLSQKSVSDKNLDEIQDGETCLESIKKMLLLMLILNNILLYIIQTLKTCLYVATSSVFC